MFDQALEHWGDDKFSHYFKRAILSMDVDTIPLKQCCQASAIIDQSTIEPMVLSGRETKDALEVKTAIFFCEVSMGCACSDDPTQAKILDNAYCELVVKINKETAQVSFVNAF